MFLEISDRILDKVGETRDKVVPAKIVSWFGTRVSVWWGFAAVHIYFLGWMFTFFISGRTFSDTELYRQWALLGYNPQDLGDVISPWVYPVLAQVPILAANMFGPCLYLLGWTLIICALNAVGMGILISGKRKNSGVAPAWFWLVMTCFLGYLSFARVEGITTSFVLVGLLYASTRPAVAAALLSLATWIKVWPAAVVAALVVVSSKRIVVVFTGIAISLAVAGTTYLTGAGKHLFDFAVTQGGRGMQLEAPFSTPWVWLSYLNLWGAKIADNVAINSTEVHGPGTQIAAFLMQPLLLVSAVTAAVLLVLALRRGAERSELLLDGSLLMISAFIVFNKVGSPQFMIWLLPVVISGLTHDWDRWKVPGMLLSGIAAATFLIYPLFYSLLIEANPVLVSVLTFRNILLVLLFSWSIKRINSLGRPAPSSEMVEKAASTVKPK